MNLTETYSMSMEEVLKQCNIVEQKIHTDKDGDIQSIEVKYVPKSISPTKEEINKEIQAALEKRRNKPF